VLRRLEGLTRQVAEAAVLVTNNEAEFRQVSGLRVENWA
jgi:predicted nucleic acid-binding protein